MSWFYHNSLIILLSSFLAIFQEKKGIVLAVYLVKMNCKCNQIKITTRFAEQLRGSNFQFNTQ